MSMASHSFGHQRSWGTFSYTVFWCISCLTGQHLACLFTEWTPASPAKSIVSQTKPRSRQVSMQNHMRHGFEDLQWIYHFLPVFAKFVMLETFGNVDILGLDIESSGLNSVILRLRRVQARISVCWSLNILGNIFNNVLCESGQCNDTT